MSFPIVPLGQMNALPIELLASVLVVSILHAILPNHWLPVVGLARQFGWNGTKTAGITVLAAFSHSLSTVIIGMLAAFGGLALDQALPYFKYVGAGILIILGVLFIWRHQHHKHFHLRSMHLNQNANLLAILGALLLAMFLSPCLEVGALFLIAGSNGIGMAFVVAGVYTLTSVLGMTFFSWLAFHGLKKMDWHRLEHNSGLVSGSILIITGILFLFSHS